MAIFQFRPAARSQTKPLIGLHSESGAGKTYSALVLARGFVGPSGKIGMVETESGRGEAYADKIEYPEIGGYDVLPLRDDFSPKNYGSAIEAAEKAKLDALIIDSASHEWEGAGGVLSQAADNEASGKKGMLVWQKPKIDHQREFMLKFMQTPIPLVILNMRSKYPMEQEIVNGKKEWVRCKDLEPKQSEDILYEMFVHGWIEKDTHNFHRTKCTSRTLEGVFVNGQPVSIETGKKLAAWAKGALPAAIASPETIAAGNTASEKGVAELTRWKNSLDLEVKETIRPYWPAWQSVAKAADSVKGAA